MNPLHTQWHTRNEHPFDHYSRSSHFNAWWFCGVCHHEWQAMMCNRTNRKSKCPNCRKLNSRGNKNAKWIGHEEIGGRQWGCIRKEASRRSMAFTVTIEYGWDLFLKQNRQCALTGKRLTMWTTQNGKVIGNAALDALDQAAGFIPGNVQWIDKRLHAMKAQLTQDELIEICEDVVLYQQMKEASPVEPVPPTFNVWSKKQL